MGQRGAAYRGDSQAQRSALACLASLKEQAPRPGIKVIFNHIALENTVIVEPANAPAFKNAYLAGNFAPVEVETTAFDLTLGRRPVPGLDM